ncbi:polymer-forming cytoskeletal protein [soil metagenome]
MATDQIDTIVGAHVELTGSLHNQGSIQIHGRIKGDIVSNASVMVGETAIVTGPITAKFVEVAGQVIGSINAEQHIELQGKSIVKGDITTKQLSIKPGAVFIGKSSMDVPGNLEVDEDAGAAKRKPRLEVE